MRSFKFVFCILTAMLISSLAISGCGGKTTVANAGLPEQPVSEPSNPSPSPTPAPQPSPTPAPAPSPAPNSTTLTKIEDMPGWQWCTAQTPNHQPCASGLGNATSSKANDQASPSLDGSSAKFAIAGLVGYSNALWWQNLPSNSEVTHFNYEASFLIDNPKLPEALEFDVNQSFNGTRYVWGSECNFKGTGKWDVWNPKGFIWVPSKVDCPTFSAGWHHILWQLERVNEQVHYISLTVDGQVFPVDIFMEPQENWNIENINVAFQMDGDFNQAPYHVWLDEVTLTEW